MWWRTVRTELIKLWLRPRTYIGFAAILVIVLVVQLALFVDGENYLLMFTQTLEQNFEVGGKILNGNLVAFLILQTLIIHVPLLVTLITGDLISGEASAGTLRLLASRPVSRNGLLSAKFFAGMIYTALLLAFLGILAIAGGKILFGSGDMLVLRADRFMVIPEADVWWRFLASFGMAFLSLGVVAALSFMISCFTRNSISPIVITMSVIILFTIIQTMDLPLFDTIRPWLFTTQMLSWKMFFYDPLPVSSLVRSALVLSAHIGLFYFIAWFHFTRKDLLN